MMIGAKDLGGSGTQAMIHSTDPHLEGIAGYPGVPDFSSYSSILTAVLEKRADPSVLADHQDSLFSQLQNFLSKLDDLDFPAFVEDRLAPSVGLAEAFAERLEVALDQVEEFIDEGSSQALKEAITLLDCVEPPCC